MHVMAMTPTRLIDPRWAAFNELDRPGLRRPLRRAGKLQVPPLVGDAKSLSLKEQSVYQSSAQDWAVEEIAPGVPRCPATYGDHQWPDLGRVRLRVSWGVRA